ncbi:MAG: hypothetical protein DMG11_14420 [Acidobacteria bacterium]|nr:MAG: hypothetical protein DMG11_14420 [Acidobacteriota bacterium]
MQKLTLGLVFTAIVSVLFFASPPAEAGELPSAISDQDFWRMVTELSEPGGMFQQEFMSNEDSAQFVIPALKETTKRGGVYIGVGPEQNFTYIAATLPKLAFVIDIRRDNMLEHLMYKALFELSQDRADFISRLFSRKRPPGLDANSGVKTLFDAYQAVERNPELYEENLRAVMDRLMSQHKFQLSEADAGRVARILNTFYAAGPYALRGSGDKNLSYAQLMAATDLTGREQGYLASEQNFRTVQELQRQNLVVPLVGDFAGDKAIRSIGQYLKERDAIVNVFYVSNVERYLFEQGNHGRQFYTNVATLPLDQSSTFIRSVTRDISRRLEIPISDGRENWRSLLFPISDSLKAFASGRIQTYRELFEIVR